MSSKEALKIIKEHHFGTQFENIAYLEMCYDIVKKDLEVLEILKNRIVLNEDSIKGAHFIINENGLPEIENDTKDYDIAWVESGGFVFKNSKEYKLLKEWLDE